MTADWLDRHRRPYDFKAPLDPAAAADVDPLLPRLIATPAFQRLRNIRFLGGIDYARIPAPNGKPGSRRYTRYQHSLGVARLALLYADVRQLGPDERRLIAVAALLHDIGHAPLSHSLEPVFKAEFAIDHHTATEEILARPWRARESRSAVCSRIRNRPRSARGRDRRPRAGPRRLLRRADQLRHDRGDPAIPDLREAGAAAQPRNRDAGRDPA